MICSVGINTSGGIFGLKNAPLVLYRQRTADVQEYLHHGPEAPCYGRLGVRNSGFISCQPNAQVGNRLG
jgi:hypothetical protein